MTKTTPKGRCLSKAAKTLTTRTTTRRLTPTSPTSTAPTALQSQPWPLADVVPEAQGAAVVQEVPADRVAIAVPEAVAVAVDAVPEVPLEPLRAAAAETAEPFAVVRF